VHVEGGAAFHATTDTNVRSVAQLLADVTDFMTLAPGDVITLGVPHGAPVVQAGARAAISIGDWAPLEIEFVAAGVAQGAQA